MDRLIVRLLPEHVRARHGDEIVDMLAGSTRPIRDRADVAIAALGLRLGRLVRPLLVAALLGVGLFTLAIVHVVGNLEDGAVEILDHWWSTFALTGLLGTTATAITLLVAQRRARAWR